MTQDEALGQLLLFCGLSAATIFLVTACLVALIIDAVLSARASFRRLRRRYRRWKRRRERRREPVPAMRVLREGIQIKLRVDPDADPFRREAAGLAEDWEQHQADIH